MKNILIFIAFSTLIAFLFCCNKDEDEDFDTCMRGCPYIIQPDEKNTPELEKTDTITDDLGLICTESTYSYAPGYSDPILFDPTTDVIAPGMILDGSSITSGAYRPLVGNRAPMTISHSANKAEAIIQNPTLSGIRAGIKELNEYGGVAPANIAYQETYVSSREQLGIAVGGNFNGFGAKVQAEFNWDSETVKSRFMIKFTQVYYSIDVNKPSSPSGWYNNTPDCQLWDVSPVYVSSVKYGRIGLLLIESEKSKLEVEAALKASYEGFGTHSKFEFSSNYENVWESTNISALLVGGSIDKDVSIGTKEGFIDWINNGTNYSEDSPGAPVSYLLRYLKDNSLSKIILAGSFTVRDCEETPFFEINDDDYQDCCPIYNGIGDKDFSGNGPKQTAKAELRIEGGNVMLNLTYEVIECNSSGNPSGDGTGASFNCDSVVFRAPSGFEVIEILSPKMTEHEEIDYSGSYFLKNDYLNGQSLVKSFELNGDTENNDVGICNKEKKERAYMAVKFYPVEIRIKKK